MIVDVLIVLNNFIHDLSAAMWFCGTCTMVYIVSEGQHFPGQDQSRFVQVLYRKVLRLTHISLAIVFIGGIVRAFAFSKYEWMPAMGREQVTLLIVKHILLFAIVAAAFWLQARLSKQVKAMEGGTSYSEETV